MVRKRILTFPIESQPVWGNGVQASAGSRVTAREQSHLMAEANQLFREIGNDAFSAPIELGRHTFMKRSDLGDSHCEI